MRFKQILFLVLCLILLMNSALFSSTFIKVNLDEIVKLSKIIFNGTIISKYYSFDEDSGKIYSQYKIEINRDYLNNLKEASFLDLCLEGGIYKDLAMIVDGMPQFNVNDKVFIFITNLDDIFPFPGGPQGVFQIKRVHGKEYIFDFAGVPVTILGQIGKVFKLNANFFKKIQEDSQKLSGYLTSLDDFEVLVNSRILAFK